MKCTISVKDETGLSLDLPTTSIQSRLVITRPVITRIRI